MAFGVSLLASGTTGLLAGAEFAPGAVFAAQTELPVTSDLPLAQVFFRESWEDAWSEDTNVYVASVRKTVGSEVGEATLEYEYGRVLVPGDATFVQRNPLNKSGWWVKIVFTPQTGKQVLDASPVEPVYWVGIVTRDQRERKQAPAGTLNGNQVLTCSSLEYLLNRVQIRNSEVATGTSTTIISRGLAFNGGPDTLQSRRNENRGANRSENKTGWGCYVFEPNPMRASRWSAVDIVEYLLSTLSLFDDSLTADVPTIKLGPQVTSTLGWYFPQNVETHGRTFWELLNQIVQPSFGVTWSIDYDNDFDDFTFFAHSFTATDITLPDSRVFRANIHPVYIDPDQDNGMEALEVRDLANKYSQVRVQGALRGSVFSLTTKDDSIQPKWLATQAADYAAGAGDLSGSGLIMEAQISTHDNYRSTEAMRHVFTTFRIPTTWSGFVSATPGEVSANPALPAFPLLDTAGDPTTTPAATVVENIRFDAALPLRSNVDYSTAVNDRPLSDVTSATSFLKAFVVWRVGGDDGYWVYGHNMSSKSFSNDIQVYGMSGTTRRAGIGFDVTLELSELEPGFRVEPSGLPHLIAADDFNAQTTKRPTWFTPTLNYEDMVVTVYATHDEYAEEVYPATPADNIANQNAVLTLRLGEKVKLDYVVQGTVLGIDRDGNLIRATNGGFVDDDRELLRNVARLAWQWYQTERVSFRMQLAQISGTFEIGELITQIGSGAALSSINSLITAIDWDLSKGTTAVHTSYTSELDVTVLI